MKIQKRPAAIKLIEKFDKQLKDILAEELRMLRSAKTTLINKLNPDTGVGSVSLV